MGKLFTTHLYIKHKKVKVIVYTASNDSTQKMMFLGMESSTCEVRLALRKFWILEHEISDVRIKDIPTVPHM